MSEAPTQPPTDDEVREPSGAGPGEVKTTISEWQEAARRRLAYILVTIFGGEISIAMLVLLLWKTEQDIQHLKDLLTLILSPTVALVGSAMGFYFGTRSGSNDTTAQT